jgi:enoyl-CoA hydratase/carnithine racemase
MAQRIWEFEISEQVALIRFVGDGDAPLTFAHAAELAAILGAAGAARGAASVVLLRGGDGVFLPDLDRGEVARREEGRPVEGDPQAWHAVMAALGSMPQPTVAAIDGVARGAAALVALGCTFRLAGEDAILGPVEASLGLVGTDSARYIVPLVGPSAATELLLTGRDVTAAAALQLGLANQVFAASAFEDGVLGWCRDITSRPSPQVYAAIQAVADQASLTRLSLLDAQPAGGPGPAEPFAPLQRPCGCHNPVDGSSVPKF